MIGEAVSFSSMQTNELTRIAKLRRLQEGPQAVSDPGPTPNRLSGSSVPGRRGGPPSRGQVEFGRLTRSGWCGLPPPSNHTRLVSLKLDKILSSIWLGCPSQYRLLLGHNSSEISAAAPSGSVSSPFSGDYRRQQIAERLSLGKHHSCLG